MMRILRAIILNVCCLFFYSISAMVSKPYQARVIDNENQLVLTNNKTINSTSPYSATEEFLDPFNKNCKFPSSTTECHSLITNFDIGIKNGAWKNVPSNPLDTIKNSYNQTVLIIASMFGAHSFVEDCLNRKANPNLTDNYGETALLWAASSGVNASILESNALKDFKIPFTSNQERLSAYALCVKYLLLKGAKITVYQNSNHMTPLHSACIAGNYEAVLALLEAAKKGRVLDKVLNAQESMHGRTPLHCVLRFADGAKKKDLPQNDLDTSIKIIQALLNYGASKTKKDDHHNTPYDCVINPSCFNFNWQEAKDLLKPQK